ncbi:MAG: patatin-like phospholipase family protein [Pseudomonadales bacterium]|nr:patatin-like phospholipase family protein [Pseudomonadales bacterium]
MTDQPLTILAGKTAVERLKTSGWQPELFDTLVGASGGAKLLGLTHLDRFLFGDYLQRSDHPMELYGSSIGSWRHAALAAPDPAAAIVALQERYLNQAWDENDSRHPSQVIDELCHWVLEGICDEKAVAHLASHPRFVTHIVTARGLGLNGKPRSGALGLGLGLSAVGNLASRQLLALGFQRVVFSSGGSVAFRFDAFSNQHVALTPGAVKPALLASGSIPFLMPGQVNVPGGPLGHYWDGGVIDYHFDFRNHTGSGLVLYPHFTDKVIKGWFDKKLPWRVNAPALLDKVVILAPSKTYLAQLPYGKIPDRNDFARMRSKDRVAYWQKAMDMSEQLADGFRQAIDADDPMQCVTPLG